MPLDLTSPPKIITFDCYGTLVRWVEVLHEAIGAALTQANRSDIDPDAILSSFSRHAHAIEQTKPHRLYKTILVEGFARAFDDHEVRLASGEVERVAHSITRMGPHPETRDVLRRLRTRYRLAIFTNSDDDLIAHNLRLLDVPIDHVITAERAGAYKPSRDLFEFGHRQMGVGTDEIVHVAMSMELDMQACHALGMRGIWINRRGAVGNPDWLPYEMLPDLRGVPALLGC